MAISMELSWTTKDIWGRMDGFNQHWRRFGSMDESRWFIYTSANPLYIYVNIHYIFSSTIVFFIHVLTYNLYAITKPPTLLAFPSNKDSIVISV